MLAGADSELPTGERKLSEVQVKTWTRFTRSGRNAELAAAKRPLPFKKSSDPANAKFDSC